MTLTAGTYKADISPHSPVFLAGYPDVQRVSTGAHDPLLATALCLSSGDRSVLMLALDLLFIDTSLARRCRRNIAHTLGLDEAAVFISCTHTHSGPVTVEVGGRGMPFEVTPPPDPQYLRRLDDALLEAASGAFADRQPAMVAWTSAQVHDVGGNRHDPSGPRDSQTGILAVKDGRSGKLKSVSVIYSMHPTVLHEDSTKISSDFPHFTREMIRAQFGSDTTVLYHTGPAGDQSPRHHVTGQTFEEAERLGVSLGQRVCESLDRLPASVFTDEPTLDARLSQVGLLAREIPGLTTSREIVRECKDAVETLRQNQAPRAEQRTAVCDLFGAESTLQLAQYEQAGTLAGIIADRNPADIQALRIADSFMVGLPGEAFVEYSLDIKTRAPGPAYVASLVNGELMGYIVTEEAARKNWYEALNRVFEPESGRRMVDAAVVLMNEMAGGT